MSLVRRSVIPRLGLSQWPDQHDERYADGEDNRRQRQAEPPVVAEPVPTRPEDEGIALMPDRRQEIAAGADGDGHQEGIDPQSEMSGEAGRHRSHYDDGGGVVED